VNVALSFPACNRRGGVERIIYECARYLSGRGHDVTVFASQFEKNGAPIAYRHVPLLRTLKPLRSVAFHQACTRAMLDSHFDAHGTFGCVCPRGGVYWAQSIHAAWIDKARALRPPWSLARWKQRLNPAHSMLLKLESRHFSKGGYRRIIALTEQVKSDLGHYYGVPGGDVDVVPNGYSPEEFNLPSARDLRDSMRRELGFSPGQKVIVFVANELDRKGYPALLRAVESMADPRLRILVAGRIAPSPHPLVTYVGSTGQVARYYAAADLFALPTLYEAWGLVIVEALATGLPVLTSRLAGASVAVRERHTGDLLDNPSDHTEIARKLRPLIDGEHASPEDISASVAPYAWSRVLVRYEEILCANSEQCAPCAPNTSSRTCGTDF
jgi:UDP-glucose:(heptosyl)LPS alpha-1,3-glucosyltransferase